MVIVLPDTSGAVPPATTLSSTGRCAMVAMSRVDGDSSGVSGNSASPLKPVSETLGVTARSPYWGLSKR